MLYSLSVCSYTLLPLTAVISKRMTCYYHPRLVVVWLHHRKLLGEVTTLLLEMV